MVADSILERARTDEADLIVMTSHRRRGMSRIEFGSVADVLIRRAQIPILLVPPCEMPGGTAAEPILDNILILLDGSTLAEHILEPALELARLMETPCNLLRVVESGSSGREPSGQAEAEAYLERVAAKLRPQGIQIRTQVVVARHVVEAILEAFASQASNLIAIATHGRGGLKRMLFGSVAEKLIRHTASLPVLVYCPPDWGFNSGQ